MLLNARSHRRLAASFALAAATLMSGCATSPQQGCDYTKETDGQIAQMTPMKKKGTDQILGAIPVVGTITFATQRINRDLCDRAASAPDGR